MNAFIFSEISAHLKINGEYMGVVDGNLYNAEIFSLNPFFELYPKNQIAVNVKNFNIFFFFWIVC